MMNCLFTKRISSILLAIAGIFLFQTGYSQESDTDLKAVLPSQSHIYWADAEIGVIIHYDINVFAPETFDYKNTATLPDLKVFNPSKLDTDQWLEAAKAAGAKYAVLVAKHGTGFTLWPSKANNYNVGNTPWRNGKGDIVADFIKSCKKYDIKPGFYYNTNFNTYYGAGYRPFDSPEKLREYNAIVLQQLTELWTQYGSLMEIWFDGGVMVNEKGGIANEVERLIQKHQPQAILFQGPLKNKNLIRWVGNEDGRAPYPHWSRTDATTSSDGVIEIKDLHGNPNGRLWGPAEADFPNRKKSAWNGGWLWHANQEQYIFSAEELVDRYYTSVGRNANMLIGMVIDTAGRFPREDYKQFVAFGNEIKRRFSKPLAETQGKGDKMLLTIPGGSTGINHVVIMEDISKGERIRKYVVEAWIDNKWKPICDGISVGHKRIHQFDSITTNKIRLSITESGAAAQIRSFSAYYVQ